MTVAVELSIAAEWRDRVLELRDVADRTEDPHLRYKLFALADRWELFAEELRDAALSAPMPAGTSQPEGPPRALLRSSGAAPALAQQAREPLGSG